MDGTDKHQRRSTKNTTNVIKNAFRRSIDLYWPMRKRNPLFCLSIADEKVIFGARQMVLTLVVNKQEGNFWCLLPFIIMGCWHPLYLLDGNSAARLMLHKGIKNTREKSNFTPCEYYSRSKSIANIKCLFAYPDLGENSAIYPINRYCSKQKGLDGEIDTKDYSVPDVLLLYPKSMQNKWSLSRKIIHCWPRIVE